MMLYNPRIMMLYMDDSKKIYEKYSPWVLIVIAILFLIADFIEKNLIYTQHFMYCY